MPRTERVFDGETRESDLLSEARAFMHVVARLLEVLIEPTRTLHARMVRTRTYQRVDGLDEASCEPMWDLAGTLRELLEEDLARVANYLHASARRPGRSPRRRRKRSPESEHRG